MIERDGAFKILLAPFLLLILIGCKNEIILDDLSSESTVSLYSNQINSIAVDSYENTYVITPSDELNYAISSQTEERNTSESSQTLTPQKYNFERTLNPRNGGSLNIGSDSFSSNPILKTGPILQTIRRLSSNHTANGQLIDNQLTKLRTNFPTQTYTINNQVDLVISIDGSGSMSDDANKLSTSLQTFINNLPAKIDLRIAVVLQCTTQLDVYDPDTVHCLDWVASSSTIIGNYNNSSNGLIGNCYSYKYGTWESGNATSLKNEINNIFDDLTNPTKTKNPQERTIFWGYQAFRLNTGPQKCFRPGSHKFLFAITDEDEAIDAYPNSFSNLCDATGAKTPTFINKEYDPPKTITLKNSDYQGIFCSTLISNLNTFDGGTPSNPGIKPVIISYYESGQLPSSPISSERESQALSYITSQISGSLKYSLKDSFSSSLQNFALGIGNDLSLTLASFEIAPESLVLLRVDGTTRTLTQGPYPTGDYIVNADRKSISLDARKFASIDTAQIQANFFHEKDFELKLGEGVDFSNHEILNYNIFHKIDDTTKTLCFSSPRLNGITTFNLKNCVGTYISQPNLTFEYTYNTDTADFIIGLSSIHSPSSDIIDSNIAITNVTKSSTLIRDALNGFNIQSNSIHIPQYDINDIFKVDFMVYSDKNISLTNKPFKAKVFKKHSTESIFTELTNPSDFTLITTTPYKVQINKNLDFEDEIKVEYLEDSLRFISVNESNLYNLNLQRNGATYSGFTLSGSNPVIIAVDDINEGDIFTLSYTKLKYSLPNSYQIIRLFDGVNELPQTNYIFDRNKSELKFLINPNTQYRVEYLSDADITFSSTQGKPFKINLKVDNISTQDGYSIDGTSIKLASKNIGFGKNIYIDYFADLSLDLSLNFTPSSYKLFFGGNQVLSTQDPLNKNHIIIDQTFFNNNINFGDQLVLKYINEFEEFTLNHSWSKIKITKNDSHILSPTSDYEIVDLNLNKIKIKNLALNDNLKFEYLNASQNDFTINLNGDSIHKLNTSNNNNSLIRDIDYSFDTNNNIVHFNLIDFNDNYQIKYLLSSQRFIHIPQGIDPQKMFIIKNGSINLINNIDYTINNDLIELNDFDFNDTYTFKNTFDTEKVYTLPNDTIKIEVYINNNKSTDYSFIPGDKVNIHNIKANDKIQIKYLTKSDRFIALKGKPTRIKAFLIRNGRESFLTNGIAYEIKKDASPYGVMIYDIDFGDKYRFDYSYNASGPSKSN